MARRKGLYSRQKIRVRTGVLPGCLMKITYHKKPNNLTLKDEFIMKNEFVFLWWLEFFNVLAAIERLLCRCSFCLKYLIQFFRHSKMEVHFLGWWEFFFFFLPMCFSPFGKLEASKDRIYDAIAVGLGNGILNKLPMLKNSFL